MRIGMSVSSSFSVANPRDGARYMIERARTAYEAGLDHLFVGDHHVTPSPYYQNTPMIARMLAEWPDRPFGALYLLPLWHPVLLAEQIGTLAAIGGGRFILQCGLGDHRQGKAMGIDMTQRAGMFEAGLDIMQRLWSGETVTDNRYWNLFDARISPLPPEAIEVWIGAVAQSAIDRTARLSSGWLAAPSLTFDEARDAIQRYHTACVDRGQTPATKAIRRDVLIGANSQDARAVAEPYIQNNYRGIKPDALMIGSPAEVEEEIGQLAELGFTDVCARNITSDQRQAIETISHLGDIRASFSS